MNEQCNKILVFFLPPNNSFSSFWNTTLQIVSSNTEKIKQGASQEGNKTEGIFFVSIMAKNSENFV